MKLNIYYAILMLMLAMAGNKLLGQDLIIGAKYSIGNAHYRRISDNFQTSKNRMQTAGITIAYSPFLAVFQLVTGAEYEILKEGNLLTVPLGCRIFVGNKFRGFVEGGGYYSFVLNDNSHDPYQLQNDAGLRSGLGIEYAPNRRLRFDVGYYLQYGMKTMLKKERLLPLDGYYFDEYKLKATAFQFGAKYRF